MRIHHGEASSYVRSKAKFHREPDFLDVSPEIRMYYHSCMMRLDMMQGEYKKALDQLRSKADIDLHL